MVYDVPSLRANTAALWVRVGIDAVVGVDTAVEIEIAVDAAADAEVDVKAGQWEH